jgi:hypothetical protein
MHAPLETSPHDMTPPEEWGPAMCALKSDKQRRFVVAMFEVKPGPGAAIRAAIRAGYGTPSSSRKSLSVIAYRLANDEGIQLAVEEEGRRRFRTLASIAHDALRKLLLNSEHKDHGKAVLACLDHALPLEFRHLHDHRHRAADPEAAILMLLQKFINYGASREFLMNTFGCNGLPALEQKLVDQGAPVVEAEPITTKAIDVPPAGEPEQAIGG